jgi:hypothetical protein
MKKKDGGKDGEKFYKSSSTTVVYIAYLDIMTFLIEMTFAGVHHITMGLNLEKNQIFAIIKTLRRGRFKL